MSFSIVEAIRANLTEDVVTKEAAATGEPPAKARSTLLAGALAASAGLIRRGATVEGASGLLSSLKSGTPGLGLFGHHSDDLVEAVAFETGASRTTSAHALTSVVPIAASVVGRAVGSQHLDATGLRSTLMGQRDSLLASPMVPSSIRSILGGNGPASDVARRDVSVTSAPMYTTARKTKTRAPWGILGLVLAGLALVGGFMMCGRQNRLAAPKIEMGETTITSGELGTSAPEVGTLAASFAKDDAFVLPNVTFPFSSTDVAPGGEATIDGLANELKTHPNTRIRLTGYTDSVGASDVNGPLSRARADAVKQLLVSKGIDSGRIETAAKGESNPVAANGTKEGRSHNRRVEATVISR